METKHYQNQKEDEKKGQNHLFCPLFFNWNFLVLEEGYFLSSTLSRWMENLGVVPLFLFSAFLFEPIFLSLFLLLFLVTAVFETIFSLLSYHNKDWENDLSLTTLLNLSYLPIDKLNVKILFISGSLYLTPAGAQMMLKKNHISHNLLISIGEHREIQTLNLQNFTVGNKDIISYKVSHVLRNILIKGKKLGFTELVTWDEKGKRTFKIYVLSKKTHLRLLRIAETLQSINLQTELKGPLILTKGTLSTFGHFRLIHRLYKKHPDSFFFKGSLSNSLKNELRNKIMKALSLEGKESLKCETKGFKLLCLYPSDSPLSKQEIKKISNYFNVSLIPKKKDSFENYLIKIKLLNLEKQDGSEFGAGLEGISGNLIDLYKNDFNRLLIQQNFYFKGRDLNLTILAEPESIIQPHSPLKIKVGSEIPIQKIRVPKDISMPHKFNWKFTGLDLNLTLKPHKRYFLLDYIIKFSAPSSQSSQSFSGNEESGRLKILLNRPLKVFEIGLKSKSKENNYFPWLKEIPILGFFFENTTTINHYKKISAVILLTKK